MSIDTYPPQSTQATVQQTLSLGWLSADATGGATANGPWLDAIATSKTVSWLVPQNYAGGDLTFTLFRRAGTAGTAVMEYSMYRMRNNTALVVLASAVPMNYVAAGTNDVAVSWTVAAANFVVADVIYTVISRMGGHASDILADNVYCDSISVTYNAYVMGYAAYPASVNNASYEEGTFVVTMTGCTVAITGTAYYVRVSKQVTVHLPSLSGTSNATTMTITGWPAGFAPVSHMHQWTQIVDNGVNQGGMIQLLSSGVCSVYPNATFGGWTASGSKILRETVLAYRAA